MLSIAGHNLVSSGEKQRNSSDRTSVLYPRKDHSDSNFFRMFLYDLQI